MEPRRPQRSLAQIAALPPFGSAQREAYLRASGDCLEPETLVHLLRESIARADTALFHYLGRLLVGTIDGGTCTGGHCERIIFSVARRFGLHRSEDQLGEFRARVYRALWQAVYEGSDEKHFWEERFGLALKDKCIEVARQLFQENRRADEEEIDIDSVEIRGQLSDNRLHDHNLGTIDESVLICAIQSLPQRQAQAAFLAFVEDRPIAGESPESVAAILGISATAAHNLLAKARAKLATTSIVRELRG